MSRVSYQAMLDPSGDEPERTRRLDAGDLPSRRRDAKVSSDGRITDRHRRWLDDVATSTGLPTDVIHMAALDVLIALDLDWDEIRRPRELRDALIEAARGHPPR